MRNLKKFLALVLAMMMTLSLMVTVNASSFDDDEDITKVYAEAVDVLTELGVIKGYGGDDPNEGKFLPKNNITRAEVAAILYRLYTGDVGDKNIHLYDGFSEFTDVGANQWFTLYVNFCANNGLIQGRGNGKFDPKGNITGYETLVMILRAIGYNDPKEFSSSDWRFKASGYGDRLGLTSNIPAGSLGASATREMVSEIMFKGILAPMVKYRSRKRHADGHFGGFQAYSCNRYMSGGKAACTSHYINCKVLTKLLLLDIHAKAMLAQNSPAALKEKILAQKNAASMEQTKALRATLAAVDKRLAELEKLVVSAYEDKVKGVMPEALCVQLMNRYEDERRGKLEQRTQLTAQLEATQEDEQATDEWLAVIRDYAQLEELDRPTLLRLVKRIEVGEKYEINGETHRDIKIYYNFVGYVEL